MLGCSYVALLYSTRKYRQRKKLLSKKGQFSLLWCVPCLNSFLSLRERLKCAYPSTSTFDCISNLSFFFFFFFGGKIPPSANHIRGSLSDFSLFCLFFFFFFFFSALPGIRMFDGSRQQSRVNLQHSLLTFDSRISCLLNACP